MSCTSKGVPRKNSTKALAGQRRIFHGVMRIRVSKVPKMKPKITPKNAMMRVARTPSTKKGQYFTTSSHMARIKP